MTVMHHRCGSWVGKGGTNDFCQAGTEVRLVRLMHRQTNITLDFIKNITWLSWQELLLAYSRKLVSFGHILVCKYNLLHQEAPPKKHYSGVWDVRKMHCLILLYCHSRIYYWFYSMKHVCFSHVLVCKYN